MKPQEKVEKRSLSGIPVEEEKDAQALSPFEIKDDLIKRAKEAAEKKGLKFLNAGRGNPNFFNATARGAFCKLMQFALHISGRSENDHVRFQPSPSLPIAKEYRAYFAKDHSPETKFLKAAISHAVDECGVELNEFLYELADASLGDFYPVPPRILTNVERVMKKYLEQVLFLGDQDSDFEFQLFAAEGGTAGMVYTFKSLEENFLLNKRDKVAIITPIFSPYLEIPQLNDFEFNIVPIASKEKLDPGGGEPWHIPKKEINKLRDQAIKVLYLVNPTNPTAVALSDETINNIANAVAVNKNLIILVDAVYATFVESYLPLIKKLPKNCIVVYSLSKYFGVTGWRLGAIMLAKDNVIDRLIQGFPAEWKEELRRRYQIDWKNPDEASFIERLVMDSRDVALAHTAGLSCPQQAIMTLFALFNLIHQREYKRFLRNLLKERIARLYEKFDGTISYSSTGRDTHYYALIDILLLADSFYKEPVGKHMVKYFYPVDFVYCLAIDGASVCLPGYGFFETDPSQTTGRKAITTRDRKNWAIRVSLANLEKEDYSMLGQHIMEVLAKYYADYQAHKK